MSGVDGLQDLAHNRNVGNTNNRNTNTENIPGNTNDRNDNIENIPSNNIHFENTQEAYENNSHSKNNQYAYDNRNSENTTAQEAHDGNETILHNRENHECV